MVRRCRKLYSGRHCSRVISGEAARLGEEAARRLARTGHFEFADDHRTFLVGLPLNTPAPGRQRNPWPAWRRRCRGSGDKQALAKLGRVETNEVAVAFGPPAGCKVITEAAHCPIVR